uniref:Zmp:0000001316 n=1 Tax=Cyprinus carpio TaxID=7962 RepID=A0A8C1NR97_CYPCA
KTKKVRQCPVCWRRSSRDEPPCNLVLKNLCESFTAESDPGFEEVCSLHNEKLKLFCLDEEQPVCVVCRDSEKHLSHRFRPINEVVSSYKEQLKTALKSLEEKLKHIENNKRDCDKTIQLIKVSIRSQIINTFNTEFIMKICNLLYENAEVNLFIFYIQTQAEGTEWQINKEFKKLHQFLRDEEEASITALRKDEEQKSQKMKEKLEEMNRQISALSDTIKDIKEKMMPHTSDASFLHVRTEYLFLCTKKLAYCPAWSNSHFVLIRSFDKILKC